MSENDLNTIEGFFNTLSEKEQTYFYLNIKTLYELGILESRTIYLCFSCNEELNMLNIRGLLVKDTIQLLQTNIEPKEIAYILITIFDRVEMDVDIFYKNMVIIQNNLNLSFPMPGLRQNLIQNLNESAYLNEESCAKLIWLFCNYSIPIPIPVPQEPVSYDDASSSYNTTYAANNSESGSFSPGNHPYSFHAPYQSDALTEDNDVSEESAFPWSSTPYSPTN
ncbi:MAG: hypothetical protein LCH30_09140 [Proteobacteria bacterium]|nr:hypothetical protein [Pseudomonadota bacterium]